jgi:hypothetical protein
VGGRGGETGGAVHCACVKLVGTVCGKGVHPSIQMAMPSVETTDVHALAADVRLTRAHGDCIAHVCGGLFPSTTRLCGHMQMALPSACDDPPQGNPPHCLVVDINRTRACTAT